MKEKPALWHIYFLGRGRGKRKSDINKPQTIGYVVAASDNTYWCDGRTSQICVDMILGRAT